MIRVRKTHLLFALIAIFPSFAFAAGYFGAAVDEGGQLQILLEGGKQALAPKLPGQTSFSDWAISPDHRTVGWYVMYPDPTTSYPHELPGKLILYRPGHILHTFTTEHIFRDWRFQDGGQRVACCTGPLHRGAAVCLLRDVGSGRIVTQWPIREGNDPPAWAKLMRY